MKILQKILSLILIFSTALITGCSTQAPKECCLCNSFRYHAPCLIDLENGELVELDLYYPHPTLVAELAEVQPKMETFSFVSLGTVTGTKLTDSKIIELAVPTTDKITSPALCNDCNAQLQKNYKCRYVLADLYDKENKNLIPITDGLDIVLRCYEITVVKSQEKDEFVVTVYGILE